MKKKEYIPFGPEWEKEVLKFNKKYLVTWLRNKLMADDNNEELVIFKTCTMDQQHKLNIMAIIDQNIIEQLEIRVKQDSDKINKLDGIIKGLHDNLKDCLFKMKNNGSSHDFIEGYKAAMEDLEIFLK